MDCQVIFSLLVKPLSFPLFSGHIRGHFHLRMCDLDCYFVLCLFPNERPFRLGSAYNPKYSGGGDQKKDWVYGSRGRVPS
jgi:hypothetical protein